MMLKAPIVLLLASQAADGLLQADDVVIRADQSSMVRCTTTLPLETVAIRTVVVCTIDSEGTPHGCRTDDAALTPAQKRVALCMAARARVGGRDGVSIEGRSVALPISYRFNVQAPPPEAASPGR
ncbi:hypothetical protein MMB232_01321 [Brevundimonas subvibrioides]|uniref:hypothetical protein n=1 Tax=Brevundimonas subvibrioides TaxID=74313 RepID=UPI0032D59876